jgi:uncharacterized protein YraI
MLRRLFLALLTGLLALAVIPTAAQDVYWTAEYYANTTLSGTPLLMQVVGAPGGDWGVGTPSSIVPADNFSARWTSVQTLAAGSYQMAVRADDGVRVMVDGSAVINQWGLSPGNTYTTQLNLSGGSHSFVVEYFEAGGSAYLQYTFAPVMTVPGVPSAIVNTNELNLRAEPNPYTGAILTRIYLGQGYPVVGKNADSSWVQLNVNGQIGWVNARYITVSSLQSVPVTNNGVRPTGAYAMVLANFLNVRQTPDPINGAIIARISLGESYPVVGKNADSSWVQLNVKGVSGWVRASWLVVVNLGTVPIVGGTVTPPVVSSMAMVITGQLNVRQIPNPYTGVILARVSLGQTFPAIGRNAAATWVQLNANGIVGWVNGRYVAVPNLSALPVTG